MAEQEKAKQYAVVAGVADYEDDQIGSLKYTKNDAIRIADLLVEKGGFDRTRVYLLANGIVKDEKLPVEALPPTRPNVLLKVKYVVDAAGEDDLILFFFAGHGAEVSKSQYLLTYDTKMDVLQHTAVSLTDLNEMFEHAKARCIVRFFDACRSPFGEGRGPLGRMTDGLQNAMLKTAKGWASFSSCSSGEIAHESGELGHGVFTYYLCEGLAGKAANESGEVPFERLVDYVKTSVGNWSDQQSQRQTPHVQSDLSGQLILARSVRLAVAPPPETQNPLAVLRFGIDKHLSQTPEDTRNLTFTDEKEWAEIVQMTMRATGQILAEFSHPSLVVSIGETRELQHLSTGAWQEFHKDMQEKKVAPEFRGQMNAAQIQFLSSEVVVPRTTLTVGVGRFSFFYWLWYLHECSAEQLQGSFTAKPRLKKGFFTFKPRAALDGRKMENTVKELLKRACEDILSWAEQLGQYVDGRLGPLREIGKVIE